VKDVAKCERDKRHDDKRREQKPWRAWYNLPIWQAIRRQQLEREPLCERHKRRGQAVVATVVHHVNRHNGVWELFISGPFESSCEACHNGEIQQEEIAGHSREIGVDGWPVDPRHRANQKVR
jgi:hypothetical protein